MRLLAAALSALLLAAAPPAKPNVVLILADDLGGRDLACYGSRYHKTPRLDRMAKEGMQFSQAYAACPVCSPTRASLLTGQYPQRFNLTDWLPGRADRADQKLLRPVIAQQLPLEAVTIAEALKPAGYRTGLFGKWHLGGEGFEPEKQGFDVNIGGDHTGTSLSYFAPFKNKAGRFMPGLEKSVEGEYLPDRLTTEALRFMQENKSQPFFLYFPHYSVHTPLRAKPDYIAKFAKDGKPGSQNNPTYAAMLLSLDDSVGRILDKLDEMGLSEKTLVIFTSDNGGLATLEGMPAPPTNNAPLREGKGYLYEGGVRVPLLARWPGVIPPGTSDDTPVCSIDLFSTILEYCGQQPTSKQDGVSIRRLLEHTGALKRDALYWHYPHYANQGSRPGSAIRAGDFKLIEFLENRRRELYNLRADPGESQNLAESQPDRVAALAKQLEAWRGDVGARGMAPNPKYVPNPQAADGSVTLPARTADVHGVQLRYEPLPHKNTLGFWSRLEDWASWEFQLAKPGTYSVEIVQGCGAKQGGSEVELSVAGQSLRFQVEDTGGWQAFKNRHIGVVRLEKEGRHTLAVKPKSKPGAAVMDLRAITLRPAEAK